MSWETVELQELCSPKQHKTIATKNLSESGYPVFGANGQIGFHSSYTHEEPTIAITCRGATCGTVNVTPEKCYINGNAMALDDLNKSKVDLNYLKYYFRNRGFHDVISGSAQPQITRAPLLTITLSLPPLPEQKRIAAILDQADALRRQRQRALDHLNQLGQSIFYEMFGDRSLDGQWKYPEIELADYCHKITDGTHQSPKWEADGVPFLFSSNIRHQSISYETKKFISDETYDELTRHSPVEKNDVLYTAVGSFGHSAVVDGESKFLFQRHIAQLKPNLEKLNPVFLAYFLESIAIRRYAEKVAKGVAQKTVTLTEIKKFPLPQVPLSTQKTFHDKVSSLLSGQEKSKAHLLKAESLFASLQQRAFRGEL